MTLENLALRRPALQSSTSEWSSDPSPAVDATIATSGDLESSRYFHTGEELFPWWQVDLGRDCVIRRVEILKREDAPHRLRRFTLLGSLDGETWLPLQVVRIKTSRSIVSSSASTRWDRWGGITRTFA